MTPSFESSYREIPLTRSKVALVSLSDHANLSLTKWRFGHNGYAVRSVRKPKRTEISMHRQILGLGAGNPLQVDHINHNKLDNRRENLRIVTCSQNHMNSRRKNSSVSGYKGVYWSNDERRSKRWIAVIGIGNNKNKHLGRFSTAEEAHKAYCAAAHKFHGEFAFTDSPLLS